jgi:translation initiation factor 1 (eIF-1/SUI1)
MVYTDFKKDNEILEKMRSGALTLFDSEIVRLRLQGNSSTEDLQTFLKNSGFKWITLLSMMRNIALKINDAHDIQEINMMTTKINNITSISVSRQNAERVISMLENYMVDMQSLNNRLREKVAEHEQSSLAA